MNDICEPCLKGDHAWCYRHERMRWWVTCMCPRHDHRDDPDYQSAERRAGAQKGE